MNPYGAKSSHRARDDRDANGATWRNNFTSKPTVDSRKAQAAQPPIAKALTKLIASMPTGVIDDKLGCTDSVQDHMRNES